jgi:hypothetical protein
MGLASRAGLRARVTRVGTAYHTSSRLWFTLSNSIVNEACYPHVDTPNTRDLQFLITGADTPDCPIPPFVEIVES